MYMAVGEAGCQLPQAMRGTLRVGMKLSLLSSIRAQQRFPARYTALQVDRLLPRL